MIIYRAILKCERTIGAGRQPVLWKFYANTFIGELEPNTSAISGHLYKNNEELYKDYGESNSVL